MLASVGIACYHFPMELPYLIASDDKGNIFEIPELRMAGMSLDSPVLPDTRHLIPLPYGSNLYMLPGTVPIGYDPDNDEFIAVEDYNGERVHAVAAFMAPAYLAASPLRLCESARCRKTSALQLHRRGMV